MPIVPEQSKQTVEKLDSFHFIHYINIFFLIIPNFSYLLNKVIMLQPSVVYTSIL